MPPWAQGTSGGRISPTGFEPAGGGASGAAFAYDYDGSPAGSERGSERGSELGSIAEHSSPDRVCRGTWARVTIDQFRHLALQTFKKYRASTNNHTISKALEMCIRHTSSTPNCSASRPPLGPSTIAGCGGGGGKDYRR